MVAIWHHIRMLELLHAGWEQYVAVIRLIWQSCLDSFNNVSLQAAKRRCLASYNIVWHMNMVEDYFLQFAIRSVNLLLCNRGPKQCEQLHKAHEFFELTLPWRLLGTCQIRGAMQAMLLVARPNYINCMTTWWLHVKFANASTTSSQTPCNCTKYKV